MVNELKFADLNYKESHLGKIPIEWEVQNLSELGEIVTGSTPKTSSSEYWNGEVPFISPTDMNGSVYLKETERRVTTLGAQTGRLIPKDTICVTCIASIGKIAISTEESITNQQINSIVPYKENNTVYLYYALLFSVERLKNEASKTTVAILNKSSFSKFPLIVPPLHEQKKIAEILSAVDEQIEKTEQLIEKTKEVKKGLMQRLLTKGLGHTQFKFSDLGEIPIEWDVVQFKDICTRIIVGIASSTSQYYTAEKAVPILRNQNIKENKIRAKDVLYITREFDEMNYKKRLRKGDLLTVRTGYPGLTAVVPSEFEDAQSFTTLISSPNPLVANPHYLAYYMNSETGKKDLTGLSAGGAQQNLNVGSLSTFKLKLPPLTEQFRIVDILFSMDDQIEVYEKEKEKQIELKKALMQQLLTGKIRVTV